MFCLWFTTLRMGNNFSETLSNVLFITFLKYSVSLSCLWFTTLRIDRDFSNHLSCVWCPYPSRHKFSVSISQVPCVTFLWFTTWRMGNAFPRPRSKIGGHIPLDPSSLCHFPLLQPCYVYCLWFSTWRMGSDRVLRVVPISLLTQVLCVTSPSSSHVMHTDFDLPPGKWAANFRQPRSACGSHIPQHKFSVSISQVLCVTSSSTMFCILSLI